MQSTEILCENLLKAYGLLHESTGICSILNGESNRKFLFIIEILIQNLCSIGQSNDFVTNVDLYLLNLGFYLNVEFASMNYSQKILLLNFLLSKLNMKLNSDSVVLANNYSQILQAIDKDISSDNEFDHVEEKFKYSDFSISYSFNYLLKSFDIKCQFFADVCKSLIDSVKELVGNVKLNDLFDTCFLPEYPSDFINNLENINKLLNKEYSLRKLLQIERFILTVDAMSYSEKLDKLEFKNLLELLSFNFCSLNTISLGYLFSRRKNVLNFERANGPVARQYTATSVNKVLIGNAPDRGGRVTEIAYTEENSTPKFRKRNEKPNEINKNHNRGRHSSRGRARKLN